MSSKQFTKLEEMYVSNISEVSSIHSLWYFTSHTEIQVLASFFHHHSLVVVPCFPVYFTDTLLEQVFWLKASSQNLDLHVMLCTIIGVTYVTLHIFLCLLRHLTSGGENQLCVSALPDVHS